MTVTVSIPVTEGIAMLAPLRVSTLACVASLAGLAAVGTALSRPEAMIERSYAQAFDRLEEAHDEGRSFGTGGFDPKHVHLSRLPAAAAGVPSFAVGDRITLSQRAGDAAVFEVIEVRPLSGAALAETGLMLPRLFVVTAVTSGRLPVQTIRFIVDADAPAAAPSLVKPHAL